MELKEVLEMFEFVTNELQSNDASISRVFPCFTFLQTNVIKNIKSLHTTAKTRFI